MKIAEHLTKPISKILKFLLRRLVFVTVAIILQMIWMTYMVVVIGEYSKAIEWVFRIFSITVVIYIANKDDNPAYKLAWTIPILLFPIFGGFLYLVLGDKQPAKKLRMELEQSIEDTEFLLGQDYGVMERLEQEDYQVAGQAKYIDQYGGYPIYENSDAKYYPSGEAMFEELIEDLKKAKHYIFMEFFIVSRGYMWDTILEIMERKAKEGVDVRLIYDDFGCSMWIPSRFIKDMKEKGIKVAAFNPIGPVFNLRQNNRDHRKITVIDGYVGFTGGINLADEYINKKSRFGHWKDTGIMLKGEAVWNLTLMFLQTWLMLTGEKDDYSSYSPEKYQDMAFFSDGYIQPYGDTPVDNEIVGENIYLNMINKAKHYVYITTPYLIIDNEMVTALTLAAKSGIDVRIITPGIPDKKLVYLVTQSYYYQLIEAGVRIFQYTPGFIHAKTVVVDDKVATVGTINFDYRSLYLHFECGVWMFNCSSIYEIKEDYMDTLAKCDEVTKEKIRETSRLKLFGQSLLRLVAPLM